MTKAQVQTLIDACRQNPNDLVTWLELKAVLEGLKDLNVYLNLTTTGSSGAATYDNPSSTLNIPNYGAALSAYVPYTGATTNLNMGSNGVVSDYYKLNTAPVATSTTQGSMYWDATENTVALVMNGTTQKVGQDQFYNAKNSTGVTIGKGQAVGFAGTDGNSGHLLIKPFLANGSEPSQHYMGIAAENIANGATGKVIRFGKLYGINTSSYTEGDILYVSTSVAGGFQTTVPTAPNNIIVAAAVISAANNGKLMVRETLGSNINNDEGVKITTPTNGQVLKYNSTSGLWENSNEESLAGYVPYTGATANVNLGTYKITASYATLNGSGGLSASLNLKKGTGKFVEGNGYVSVFGEDNIFGIIDYISGVYKEAKFNLSSISNNNTRTYTLPNASGTIALTSDIPSLSGYVQGSGTTNYVSKFTASGTIGNSQIFDNGSFVGIGTTTEVIGAGKLQVAGGGYFSGNVGIGVSPLTKLHVAYDADFSLRIDGAGSIAQYRGNTSTGGLEISTNLTSGTWGTDGGFISFRPRGTEALRLASTGAATFSSSVTAGGKYYATASINDNIVEVINSDLTNGYGFYIRAGGTASNRYVARFKNGADQDVMWIASSGNVGIGTTSPTSNYGFERNLTIASTNNAELQLSQTGNNKFLSIGITSTMNYFQTTSGHGYAYEIGGSEKMRLTSAGYLLVGSIPVPTTDLLQVAGSARVDYLTSNGGALINTTSNRLVLYNSGGGTNAKKFGLSMTNGDYMKIFSLNDNETTRTDNIITATINGNVGIGMTSPSAKLHVANNAAGTAAIFTNTNDSDLFINFNTSITTLMNTANAVLAFGTNNTERMRITSAGKFIFSNTPTSSSASSVANYLSVTVNGTDYLIPLHNLP